VKFGYRVREYGLTASRGAEGAFAALVFAGGIIGAYPGGGGTGAHDQTSGLGGSMIGATRGGGGG